MRTILGLGRRCQLVGGCGSNEDEDEDVNVEGASKSRIAPPRSPPKLQCSRLPPATAAVVDSAEGTEDGGAGRDDGDNGTSVLVFGEVNPRQKQREGGMEGGAAMRRRKGG